ncbi:MAG: hypothetical protein Q8K75_08965 [Chlamydiales bacterium]|nr:hypothetical protein [Chlamydiales bacterium]
MRPEAPVFYLQQDNIYAVPIIHYNMEMTAQVKLAFDLIQPDCVAVELAETMQLQLLHAASRLPDISVVCTYDQRRQPVYYMSEPCDGAFEALRSALEKQIAAFCIDLDVDNYPEIHENFPDPYAVHRIGLEAYYKAYRHALGKPTKSQIDQQRELYMARRLKELSLTYDKVLFVGGMYHVEDVLHLTKKDSFPNLEHVARSVVEISTLTEDSCRDVLAEPAFVSHAYEEARSLMNSSFPPDRQKLIYQLYKDASVTYTEATGCEFPGYNLRNLMKFVRNYALLNGRLMPDLFQLLTSAKGCVDHNYAYEVWQLATSYPHLHNIDSLNELDLSIEEVWGHSKIVRFHMREPRRKGGMFRQRRKDRSKIRFKPPGPFSICSYPPEDVVVERFGDFLQKKGTQLLSEESARTVPFTTSLEDGIDTRETIRHWHEHTLYVKTKGKPPGGVGSVVIVFDEDRDEDASQQGEKYPWRTTWLGEHSQESDMAFYATPITQNVVGPGISRCEYGGFMMSYPPRRMFDVWSDPDYADCRTKAEVLLTAAVDYAVKPVVVYVASTPPRSAVKSFAKRFGKKIVYIPMGQLSPVILAKLRIFHVLDGHDRRDIAGEYIF